MLFYIIKVKEALSKDVLHVLMKTESLMVYRML